MLYKKIDISQAESFHISEELAKAFIDWRIDTKKAITQRIFDGTLNQACECSLYDMTAEEAIDRVMEANWSGMRWVLKEAKKCHEESLQESTRSQSLRDGLTDRSWAEGNASTRDRPLSQDLKDLSCYD